jgi:hypothetical protein
MTGFEKQETSTTGPERPKSITIIAALLFLSFLFNVLENILSPPSTFLVTHFPTILKYIFLREGIPGALLMCLTLGIPIVTLASAIGLMLARKWSRWLYVVWTGVYMVLHWFVNDASSPYWVKFAGFIPWAVLIYYLTRPDVSEFFHGRRFPVEKRQEGVTPEPAVFDDVWASGSRR